MNPYYARALIQDCTNVFYYAAFKTLSKESILDVILKRNRLVNSLFLDFLFYIHNTYGIAIESLKFSRNYLIKQPNLNFQAVNFKDVATLSNNNHLLL